MPKRQPRRLTLTLGQGGITFPCKRTERWQADSELLGIAAKRCHSGERQEKKRKTQPVRGGYSVAEAATSPPHAHVGFRKMIIPVQADSARADGK